MNNTTIKFLTSDSDGQTVDVPVEIANLFNNTKYLMEDMKNHDDDASVPVPISSEVLSEIVKFAEIYSKNQTSGRMSDHLEDETTKSKHKDGIESLQEWENEFFKELCLKGDIKFKLMFEVLDKANFLEFNPCIKMLTKELANLLKSFSEDKINEVFENCDTTDDQKMALIVPTLGKPFDRIFFNKKSDTNKTDNMETEDKCADNEDGDVEMTEAETETETETETKVEIAAES